MNEQIQPGAFSPEQAAHIPVYLPDRTEVGTAEVDVSTGEAVITLHGDSTLMQFMKEEVVGLSVSYLDKGRAEEISLESKGEQKDDTTRRSSEEASVHRGLHDQEGEDPLA